MILLDVVGVYFAVYMFVLVVAFAFFLICEGITTYKNGCIDRLIAMVHLLHEYDDTE